MTTPNKKELPKSLYDAYEWTNAAGEIDELRNLNGRALTKYVNDSAKNAAENDESVSASDLRDLSAWLKAGGK